MPDRNQVLRTVYLPANIDDIIRVVAFREHQLKSELLSQLVQEALVARGITDVDSYIKAKNEGKLRDA
jgi:hypothetical protein